MRVVAILLLLASCKTDTSDKDRQIAELAKKLADAETTKASAAQPAVEHTGDENPPLDLFGRVVYGKTTKEDITQLTKDSLAATPILTYKLLKKNPDRFTKRPASGWGKVVEIVERDGASRGRIAMHGDDESVIYFEMPNESDIVEGDSVDFVGMLTGAFSYKSQAGWDMTLPAISLAKMTKRRTRRSSDDE